MDYEAKIADMKGAIKIKTSAHQSTSVLLDRLAKIRTLQIKAEMRNEKKQLKVSLAQQ